ncbi:hypothetical protein [Streptomyces sp. NPDC057545]|uniref:hypothetical protein n=1 Tax=Streptomyces sp. NPDC057545 TaxID=3346164 RepID=UPI0036A16699
MADQRLLDVLDGGGEEERLWEALSGFKKTVRGLVERTGLSTNALADMHNFGKGKVATWQTPKREGPNIPPLRFARTAQAALPRLRRKAPYPDRSPGPDLSGPGFGPCCARFGPCSGP